MKPSVRSAALGLGLWLAALSAQGAVPTTERIERAIAKVNTSAGRNHSLQINFVMQVGERASVANGVLVMDPVGSARLELRGDNGLLERHLLLGAERTAVRNGEILLEPRYFLPPLYLLQASSGQALHDLLLGLGISPDAVALGECGDHDCLVVGDASHAIERRGPPLVRGLELYDEFVAYGLLEEIALEEMRTARWSIAPRFEVRLEVFDVDLARFELPGPLPFHPVEEADSEFAELEAGADSEEESFSRDEGFDDPLVDGSPDQLAPDALGGGSDVAAESAEVVAEAIFETLPGDPSWPALWVDRANFQILGMDEATGTSIRLGPAAEFQGLRVPAWIRIEEPGKQVVRYDVVRASRVDPVPAAFSREWLLSPGLTPPGP